MNPYDELLPHWRAYLKVRQGTAGMWVRGSNAWTATCRRVCGEGVSIAWGGDCCIVAGCMMFEVTT